MTIKDLGTNHYASTVARQDPQVNGTSRTAQTSSSAKKETSSSDTMTLTGDRVTMSTDALLHQEAFQAASTAGDIRQDKVSALKSLVDSGQYDVDARLTAESLITFELELDRQI